MVLSRDLAKQFAKATKDKEPQKKETILYGKAKVEGEGDSLKYFVQLDGSDIYTPVDTTVEVETNERVTVMMKGHNAVITGNISSPSARKITVDSIEVNINADIEDAKSTANNAGAVAGQAMSAATSAKYTALNYIKADADGFIVGNIQRDSLGRNILVTPTDLSIRNEDDVLASFDEDSIELGKNTKTASVKFCNGRAILGIENLGTSGENTYLVSQDKPLIVRNTAGDLTVSAASALYLRAGSYGNLISQSTMSITSSLSDINLTGKNLFYIDNSLATANKCRPWYKKPDSFFMEWYGGGFITNSGKDVYFTIPLTRPVLGNPSAVISSDSGIKIRSASGGYLYGSGASTFVKPTSYSGAITGSGYIKVVATMPTDETAANNAACGITASIKIYFG